SWNRSNVTCAASSTRGRCGVRAAVANLGNRGLDVGDQEEAAEYGDAEHDRAEEHGDPDPEAGHFAAQDGGTEQHDPDGDFQEQLVGGEDDSAQHSDFLFVVRLPLADA